MAPRASRTELRHFGLIVGGIFGAIGLWPVIARGQGPRSWMWGVALTLIVPAAVAPWTLAPAHRAWTALGNALGWVNTRIVLGLIFFGVVTPTGLVLRIAGRDPMRRTFDSDAMTYRVPRKTRPGTHMTRQF
jgi:saxitoxin biosynthesis operon SxtJ-like protein